MSTPTVAAPSPRLLLARVVVVAVGALTLSVAAVGIAHGLLAPETVALAAVREALTDPLSLRVLLVVGSVVPLLAATAAAALLVWHGREGWMPLLLALTLVTALGTFPALIVHDLYPGARPLVELIGILGVVLLVTALFAFPDGRFVPPWSRWAVLGGVVLLTGVLGPLPVADLPARTAWEILMQLPESLERIPPGRWALIASGFALPILGGLAAQAYRYRRVASPEQRRQTRWVMGTLGAFFALTVGGILVPSAVVELSGVYVGWVIVATAVPVTLFPLTVVNAVLRHRLHGIDVAINKTLVYGLLAAFITVVYIGIVVGLGWLLGGMARPGTAVSILATAVVAVAFQPVRERVQGLANRLVYGDRASRYQVVADFGRSMAASLSLEEVLPQMARAVGEGVGAARARVTVRLPGGGSSSVDWPASESEPAGGWDRVVTVAYRDEPVGEITLVKPAGEPLLAEDEALLADLAAQAGLALRNVALAAELHAHLEEIAEQAETIRASRQRIVVAEDGERRRMERKIHNGAQQRLVAMSIKLGLAEHFLEDDPGRAVGLLAELSEEANYTLEELRDLARGVFPPLLADEGLLPALRAHVRKHAIPAAVEVEASVAGARFDGQAEVAAYFCALEALANATAYAPGSHIEVRLAHRDGHLEVTVADDGPGFEVAAVGYGDDLQSMLDRAEALGGDLHVDSRPGAGTTVTARIPAEPADAGPTPQPAPAGVSSAQAPGGV